MFTMAIVLFVVGFVFSIVAGFGWGKFEKGDGGGIVSALLLGFAALVMAFILCGLSQDGVVGNPRFLDVNTIYRFVGQCQMGDDHVITIAEPGGKLLAVKQNMPVDTTTGFIRCVRNGNNNWILANQNPLPRPNPGK